MEPHTQIVELYGLPACGKSTLAEYIDTHYAKNNIIASIHKGKDEIRNNPFKYILDSPIKSLNSGYKFTKFFTKSKDRQDMSLFDLLMAIHVKHYNIRHSKYRYIVDDNSSLIQQIVSWERGEDYHSDPYFQRVVNNMLDCFPQAMFVYCQVDIDVAVKRIISRKREVGRLDKIALSDIDKLQQEFSNERNRFDKITDLLEKTDKHVLCLNMNSSTQEICDNLFDLLSINNQ